MSQFLAKRFLQALFVLLAVALIVFWAIRLSGDPTLLMLGDSAGSISDEELAALRASLGVDQPFWVQFGHYILALFQGDMGTSFFTKTPVMDMIAESLPDTLLLAVTALVISVVISLPAGIYAAINKGRWPDQVLRVVSLLGLSFPNFWLALIFVLIFSVTLGWLPASGNEGFASMILPTVTLGLILATTNIRLVRTTMLDTLSAQYIIVARGKGLKERVVLYKHALRNCAIPLVTYLGLQFGNLMGGVVIIEQVFARPGMGSLAFDAIAQRDFPVLQGTVIALALIVILVNLTVDILYGVLDPRIREA
ncbi:ABC transporter permease [Vibrio sp.]|nr:ABC transporter permease [Vibrio sp.]